MSIKLCNGRKWAVRCFLREFQDHQHRYEAISRALQDCQLRYKVGFVFQLKGIRIHNQWYPILKMEWVDGKPLNVYVESLLRDGRALQDLAQSWYELIEDLRKSQIAHGDLQHGNVLVASSGFKLIDYDGMYVPALRGMGSHEEGHRSYQHPSRSSNDFGLYVDNFAALVIYVVLLALSEQPALWSQFDNGDNLLFLRDDFLDPSCSRLFAALLRLKNPDIGKLVKVLQKACTQNVDQVPQITDLMTNALIQTEEIVSCTQCGQKNRIDFSKRTSQGIWKCGRCGQSIRAVMPEWVRQWRYINPDIVQPSHPTGMEFSWFNFVLSWERPGIKIEKHTRYEPVYEQRQRQVKVRDEPIYEERIRQVQTGSEPVYEERTRQVEKKDLWGLFGKRLITETYKVQIGTRPIMSSESYMVTTGTRSIMRMENHTIQVGTRPVVEEKKWEIKGHSATTNAVCFSGDGSYVLSTGDDRYIFIWNCASGDKLQEIQGHDQKISSVTLLSAGRFATCSWDKTIKIWRRDGSLERTLTIPLNSRFYALAARPDGKLVAGAIGHKKICVWDTETGRAWPDLRGHTRKVLAVSFFPDGKRLISGSSDMTVRVWNMSTRRCEKVLYGHSDEVNCVAVSPNGQLIASGGSDRVIFLWDAQTGTQRLRIHAKSQGVFALVFSPDARSLLSGGTDHIIRRWDVNTGREEGHLDGHTGSIRGLALS